MLAAPPPKIDLTKPQLDALNVMAEVDGPVSAGKHKTRRKPIPKVNMVAATSLVKKKLASTEMPNPAHWSPYTHDYKYEITEAGRSQLVFHYPDD